MIACLTRHWHGARLCDVSRRVVQYAGVKVRRLGLSPVSMVLFYQMYAMVYSMFLVMANGEAITQDYSIA